MEKKIYNCFFHFLFRKHSLCCRWYKHAWKTRRREPVQTGWPFDPCLLLLFSITLSFYPRSPLTLYLCSRFRRQELRCAWIGTAKVWMTCASSHLKHPWGQCCPWIPPIVTPLGSRKPPPTQSWLLTKAFTRFRLVKPNLSTATGHLTASLWTCWVMNSFWNSYFSYIKAKGHFQVQLDFNVTKTRMSNIFSTTRWWYWQCRGFTLK